MEIGYTREQFGKASYALAVGLGDLRERVYNAMLAGVIHASDDAAGVPVELQDRINSLVSRLSTVVAVGGEGSLRATLTTLSDDDLQDAAREIVDLEYLLNRVGRD